jgi:hypothetical protein
MTNSFEFRVPSFGLKKLGVHGTPCPYKNKTRIMTIRINSRLETRN